MTSEQETPGTSQASTTLVPVRNPDASGLSPEEVGALKAQASDLVRQLEEATGSAEMALADGIAAVGVVAQRRAAHDLDLLRMRVGDMLGDNDASSALTKDLIDLRVLLDRINPGTAGDARGLLRALPFSDTLLRRLQRIAVRYETVSRQVVTIERRLVEGRTMLQRDNVELRKLYEQVEDQQTAIERNAYLGEALMAELEALRARLADAAKQERIQTVLFDVAMRVQDLRTVQEVHNQFFVSIDLTRVNNSRLGQAVDRTLTLTTNTLMVGLAIQAALSKQRRVLEATRRTREYLGDLIAANAASIKQQVTEIGDVYRSPVIAIEKLSQAHADLMEAVNLAGRLEAESIQTAKTNVERLKQLTSELPGRLPSVRGSLGESRVEA
jgi:uncharacterized protein YaaN involved in tellurite resistance